MPIQPLNLSSYNSIPDEEDVTPIDGTIAKQAKKSSKTFIIFIGLIVLAILAIAFLGIKYETNDLYSIKLYQTSMGKSNQMMHSVEMNELYGLGLSQTDHSRLEFKKANTNGFTSYSTATVDSSKKYQKIIGFGGAFTESAAYNFFKLPFKIQDQVIELYFGEHGIGLTLGRVHINSCDFSLKSYSFDEVPDDFALLYFDTEVTHDNAFMLPMIRLAMEASARPIKILASPWSPPTWMKVPQNGKQTMTGSATPNGLIDNIQIKTTWANYISKFITAYKDKGVPIWAVTPQNEPEFPAPWEACSYNSSFERDFINGFLGPSLRTNHPDILILAYDHNKDHLKHWAETMFDSSVEGNRKQYVDGMAFHWYGGGERVTDGTYGYDAVNQTYHLAPDKVLLASEGCSCPDVRLDSWIRAERLAHDIMFDVNNYAQGWIDWNLLVDYEGGPNHLGNMCDASIVTLPDYSNIYIQPKYYYFGQISKFVTPGSTRIASTIVGDYGFQKIDPNVQGGLEVGLFACEKSTRQLWTINNNVHNNTIELASLAVNEEAPLPENGIRWLAQLCIGNGDSNRNPLRLVDCGGSGTPLSFQMNQIGQIIDQESSLCVTIKDDVREPGALLELAPCVSSVLIDELESQVFHLTDNGEIVSNVLGMCVTAGWPFLNSMAVITESKQTVVVIMNEASVSSPIVLQDTSKKGKELSFAIEARAIQTLIY
eukprot:gene15082-20294_t